MSKVLWLLFLLLLVVLQSSIIPFVTPQGVEPDLLLLAVTSAGILRGREMGVSIGFFAGILQDLASGGIIGSCALAKMLTGFVSGRMERKVFKENLVLPLLAAAAATLFHSLILLLLYHFLGYQVILTDFILHHLGPLIALNVILAIPIHQLVYRLSMTEM